MDFKSTQGALYESLVKQLGRSVYVIDRKRHLELAKQSESDTETVTPEKSKVISGNLVPQQQCSMSVRKHHTNGNMIPAVRGVDTRVVFKGLQPATQYIL